MSPAAPGTLPAATPLVVQFAASPQSPDAPPTHWNTRITAPSSSRPEKSEKRPLPVKETEETPPPACGAVVRNHAVPTVFVSLTQSSFFLTR